MSWANLIIGIACVTAAVIEACRRDANMALALAGAVLGTLNILVAF